MIGSSVRCLIGSGVRCVIGSCVRCVIGSSVRCGSVTQKELKRICSLGIPERSPVRIACLKVLKKEAVC